MLAAEAVRLAAIEALCPTAAIAADSGYPTLARHRVFDSRAANLRDLDRKQDYTPVLALYTAESGAKLRGPLTDATDSEADAVIDIVAELAVSAKDGPDAGSEEFVDAMAGDDAEARLVLAAMISQVRYVLAHSQAGVPFRRICKQILNTECQTFAIPQLGLRYHRVTMRLHCQIRDDDFDVPAGQLPEPMRSLFAALPTGSYARTKLAALAAHFNPDVLPALEGVTVTTGPVQSGPDF
ncbi:MAG: hypothetical protein JWR80_8005 [Bradyrhizobium sp.]|nr:hypothetical protein [Bradyrhizobium sp.]